MRHRTSRRSKLQDIIGITVFVLLFCVAAGWWPDRFANGRALGSPSIVQAGTSPFEISGFPASSDDLSSAENSAPIYGHSLVPGGIHSVDELAALMRNDPLLAEHYKGFDLSKVHFIILDHDVAAYVSFRVGARIYWEAHPTVINKGELVLPDGTNFVRARCGDRISYVPLFPTTSQEPADMDVISKVTRPDPTFPAPARHR